MASFSWRHPFRSIGELIFGTPEPSRQEPIFEPPPPTSIGPDYFPPDYEPLDNYDYDSYRHQIWGDISGEDEYGPLSDKAWELFENTGIPTGHDYQETNAAFDDFLRAFWKDTDEEGHILRSQFYETWDIVPDVIDWDEWREWRDTP